MFQRLYQVCLTYVLRWPLWLVALLYAGACFVGGQVNVDKSHSVSPELQHPGPMVNVTPGMSLNRLASDTRSVYWNAEPRALIETADGGRSFPRVVSVQIVGSFQSGDDLRPLRSLPNVEELSFLGQLPPTAWDYVGTLSRLRHLQILEGPSDANWQAVQGLSELQILDVMQVRDYPKLFEAIQHLPKLRTLVLPGPIVATFRESDWERLRSLRSLSRLYLRGNVSGTEYSRMELRRIQQILPGVQVRPATVSEGRSNVLCYVVIAGMLIWGSLSVQLQTQFSHSSSRVIPNYSIPHLTVAVALWVTTSIIGSLILWRAGCSPLASIAGSLVAPAAFWLLVGAMLRSTNKQNQVGALHPFFAMAMCLQMFPISAVLSRFLLSDLDWFLAGEQPLLAAVISAAGLVIPLAVMRLMPRLHPIYEEGPAGAPPLELSPKLWTSWGKKLADARQTDRRTWWSNNQSASLDAVLAASDSVDRSCLWSAANGVDCLKLCGRFVGMCLSMTGTILILNWLLVTDFAWQSTLWLVGWQICLLIGWMWIELFSFAMILVWRARRPILGYELLRPANRQQFVRQLCTAIWRDLRLLLICHLCVAFVAIGTVWTRGLPDFFSAVAVTYLVFRALTLYATLLFLLAIRRFWLVATGVTLIWILDCASGMYLGLALFGATEWYPATAISLYAAGAVIAGLGVLWVKRYWQWIELA